MIENREEAKGGAAVWLSLVLIVVFLILPLLYVLSIGPAIVIVQRLESGHQVVEVVYAPVTWLHDNTPLKKPLEAYAGMWISE